MLRHKLLTAGFLVLFASLTAAVAANQKDGSKGDAAKGKTSFETNCAVCHNVDTDEKKMSNAPSLKGLFKRKTLQNGKPMNDANVLEQINSGGNGMPPFTDMLSADDKANVMAYLHTL
jgi:mono/diheme cytochrome c family protein